MKKTVKQVLSLLLTLCLVFALLPVSASAASSYNASKSLDYAKTHWDDGKGECAEFVSDCLNAGGLSSWHVECTALYNQLVKEVVNGSKIASIQYLTTYRNNIRTADNKGKISKGDVIFWRCPNCPSDNVGGDIQHTALISDVSGTYVKVYQHNNPMNNAVTIAGNCYCCGRPYGQIIVIHFGDSPSSTPKVTEYFNCNVTIQTTKGKAVNLYKNPTDSSRNDYYDRGGDLSSTYGAKLSDGSTWYRVLFRQGNKDVNLWLNAASSGVKIINNIVDPSISFSPSSLSMDVGDTKTVSINFKGDEVHRIGGTIEPKGLCGANWGDTDWNKGTTSLVITGKNEGTATITVNLMDENNKVLHSKSFSATINNKTYTVSYNANGGSGAPSSQTKQYNKALALSSVKPVRTGYVFKGWSTSSSSSSVSYQPGGTYTGNSNLSLYAVWERGPAEPSISISPSSLLLNLGDSKTVSINVKAEEGYNISREIGDNSICSASWGSMSASNDGSVMSPLTVTGKSVGSTQITIYLKNNKYGTIYSKSFNVTVATQAYTVSYNANGGSGAPSSQAKTHDKSLTLSSQQPTRSGYQFMGWATSSNSSGVSYQPGGTYTGNKDLTLYAVWQKDNLESSITFSPSSITLEPGASKTVFMSFKGDNIKSFSYSNMNVETDYNTSVCTLDWSDIDWENGTRSVTVTGIVPGTASVTAYFLDEYDNISISASFSVTVNGASYTVFYDANGGEVQLSSTTVSNGSTYSSLPTPIRKGYTFEGWYTSRSGGNRITADTTVNLTDDQTLYAHWAKKDNTASSGSLQNFSARNVYFDGLFRDVTADAWYSNNVAAVYQLGLMNGVGENIFDPQSNVTIAQAVTLAARLHSIYYTGEDDFRSYDGGKWYDPYVNYARNSGIISENYNFDIPATRELFVHILAQALPADVLQAIRDETIQFADAGSILYAGDINLLCKAGVITGVTVDGKTYFYPQNTITRAEASAIVTRMVQPELRMA